MVDELGIPVAAENRRKSPTLERSILEFRTTKAGSIVCSFHKLAVYAILLYTLLVFQVVRNLK